MSNHIRAYAAIASTMAFLAAGCSPVVGVDHYGYGYGYKPEAYTPYSNAPYLGYGYNPGGILVPGLVGFNLGTTYGHNYSNSNNYTYIGGYHGGYYRNYQGSYHRGYYGDGRYR